MKIHHHSEGTKGYFFVGEEDNRQATMTYTLPLPGRMIIDHTEVDDELRGKNIGYQMVDAAVAYARTHSIKIIPLCPFAKAVFQKKPELRDVLASQ